MIEPACENRECKHNKIKIGCSTISFEYIIVPSKNGRYTIKNSKRVTVACKLDSGAIIYKKLCESCAKSKTIINKTLRDMFEVGEK